MASRQLLSSWFPWYLDTGLVEELEGAPVDSSSLAGALPWGAMFSLVFAYT